MDDILATLPTGISKVYITCHKGYISDSTDLETLLTAYINQISSKSVQ